MSQADSQARWQQAGEIAQVDSGTRVVVLGLSRLAEQPRVLADSGAVIWRLLAVPSTEAEVIAAVAAAYDVEPDVVADDVTTFVDRLHELELVERSEP